ERADEADNAPARRPHSDEPMTRPKPKAKGKPRADDEDDDRPVKPARKRGGGNNPRDGAAATALGLPTGFDDPELMEQVEALLEDGEVLHFACRPSEPVARYQA